MLHAKFARLKVRKSRFFICHDFANGKVARKWAWPTPNNSAKCREHIGMIFNNVQHIKWEL